MKILSCYMSGAMKLCHRSAGDVVQLSFNDGTIDKALYMVIINNNNKGNLVNLKTGKVQDAHTSTRCYHFGDATLDPEPNED